MKLVIKNEVLQKLLSVASKCINPSIALGAALELKYDNNKLNITTYDGNTYLFLNTSDVISCDNGFQVAVKAEDFIERVNKLLPSLDTTFTIENYNLHIVCGKYDSVAGLPLNSEGNTIKFPEVLSKFNSTSTYTLKEDEIKKLVSSLKGSLPKEDLLGQEYMNYLFSDEVIATDSEAISTYNKKLFNEDMLVSPKVLDLILYGAGDTTVSLSDSQWKLENSTVTLLTNKLSGIENFNKSLLQPFIDKKYDSFCEVNISGEDGLKYALDLVAISVENIDREIINLKFDVDKIVLSSINNSAVFEVKYLNSQVKDVLNTKINIRLLKNQLSTVSGDTVKILFTDDKSICLDCSDVLHIMSLS